MTQEALENNGILKAHWLFRKLSMAINGFGGSDLVMGTVCISSGFRYAVFRIFEWQYCQISKCDSGATWHSIFEVKDPSNGLINFTFASSFDEFQCPRCLQGTKIPPQCQALASAS